MIFRGIFGQNQKIWGIFSKNQNFSNKLGQNQNIQGIFSIFLKFGPEFLFLFYRIF